MARPGILIALAASLAGLLSSATPPAAAMEYPGPKPGPFRFRLQSDGLVLSNRVLSAHWRWNGSGPRNAGLRDQQTGQTLALTGEVFQIILTDDRRLNASALRPSGPPLLHAVSRDRRSARAAAQLRGSHVEVPLQSDDGAYQIVWRVIGLDNAGYFRQEVELVPRASDVTIREVRWLEETMAGAQRVGRVDGSPLVAGAFFFGFEDPMAANVAGDGSGAVRGSTLIDAAADPGAGRARNEVAGARPGPVLCRLVRDATLRRGERLTQSFVWGVAPDGQRRRAFLHYLERERAHPYRPFLHYNSWYDIAWHPFALNETNCLEAIRITGERFIHPHRVVMDAMVFDDGWDDPKTMWQFHRGFPRGFAPLADLCGRYRTRLGVWLSPFGGYGEPKEQRLRFGREQGLETNPTGFSLAGPRYYGAFKQACLGMMRQYGVNHFKFDGIASGMYADGSGADYILDTEAMRRLMLELRQEDPNVYINLTTGSWPSPFWLRHADSVWRQGGDMGHAGPGSKQQQWLTYRDQEVFRNIVRKGPLFPLNSLMTQGVAYSREGMAGDPTFDSAGFKDDVRAFFGAGTSLQELYIQPAKLTASDWAVLAEAARWSRANAGVLRDTHWVGGDPSRREVYGYASWTPRKGILMLRNPDDRSHEFALNLNDAFELPPGAPTRFELASPWAEDRPRAPLGTTAGKPVPLVLQPFQVLVLEATPLPAGG